MKAQILKIAGVKSEKEFYKKYPSEAAFMKKHGKEFKKAQTSGAIDKAQNFGNLSDTNNNGVLDVIENPYNMNTSRFGQTANYADTQGYQSQPAYLQKPPMSIDDNYTPTVEGYPRQSYTASDMMKQGEQMIEGSTPAKQSLKNSSLKTNKGPGLQAIGNVVGGFVGGMQKIEEEKKQRRLAEDWAGASTVVKDAAISNAYLKKQPNKWFRPDDQRFVHNTNEQTFQQGRGTDVLNVQNGSFIGGNPTEVQNTYAPEHTLYDDLGYAPLQDEEQVKAFQDGGSFGQGSPFDSLIGGSFGNSGGYQAGSSLGSAFGPGGAILGGALGGILDNEGPRTEMAMGKIKSNNDFISRLNYGNSIHSQFNSHMKNGGYMNPEYNPQVITMFGDHNSKDFADYAHKYRAGGHLKEYTAPSERAMQTYENGGEMTSYAMGGQLQTHWGGQVNTIAQNPYLPGSGEIGMLSGASHDNGGIGISYNGGENGYQSMAANGAEMGAQVEAETGEPIIEMAEGGSINPQTGQPNTSAVIFGNIPFSKKLANATGDEDLIKLADKYDGNTYKKIISKLALPQEKANKTKVKASEIANDADNTKWGALDLKTAEIMHNGADETQKDYASTIMKLANLQNAVQDVKKEKSYAAGYNLSAEELGKGNEVRDYDPITKDAELENPYAKSGAYLRKAQTGFAEGFGVDSEGYNYDYNKTPDELVAMSNPGNVNITKPMNDTSDDANYVSKYGITPWQGNVGKGSKYGKATKSSFSTKQWDQVADKLGFKGKGNKEFQEFLLKNPESAPLIKARHEKLYGKDTPMVDEKLGYGWAADELLLPKAAEIPADTATKQTTDTRKTTKTIPYERNKIIDIANMLLPFFKKNNNTPLDPRQLAGEYMAIAQNQEEPVPSQQYTTELDPIYRVTNQEVRNQSTADFRDAMRMNQFNPAAAASIFGRKAQVDQSSIADEFRTNQAIEQQIFGGNRAKINQERMANIQLNADQMGKQALAKSKTKETQQAAIASIANKYLQNDALNLENNVYKNLYSQYGFDSSGKISNQGPWFQPNIPQIYGNKASLKQVPVYAPDGKTIDHYELQPYDPDTTTAPYQTPGIVAKKKNGGSVVKNAKNSSVVKAFKNL